MILTLLLVALTCFALLPVVWPLLRGARQASTAAAFDQAVYQDQLRELDRDVARGLLSETEAAASRVEIQRRLLATTRPGTTTTPSLSATPALALGLILFASVGSIALYALLSPPILLPDPMAERRGEIEGMVARLRERLAQEPTNVEAWRLYGRSTAVLGDWAGAIDAYRRAIALGDASADTQAALGEVLAAQADGRLVPAARAAFGAALAAEPTHAMSRYYMALARGEDGDPRGAIDVLRTLAADIPADAPVRAEIARQVARLAEQAGIAVPTLPPGPGSPAPDTAEAGPDRATMEAMANLPAEQRAGMVRSMVDRLAERLAANPDDFEGWMRLARSYTVLRDPDKAADAYETAARLRPDDVSIPLRAVEALLTGLALAEPLPPRVITILRRIEATRPDEPAVLWYLGMAAAKDGRKAEALDYWRRLRAALPPGNPDAEMVRAAIEALEASRSAP